jgi:hypothetical protein
MRGFLRGFLWLLVMQGTIAAGFAVPFVLPSSLGLTLTLLIYLLIAPSGMIACVWWSIRKINLEQRRHEKLMAEYDAADAAFEARQRELLSSDRDTAATPA